MAQSKPAKKEWRIRYQKVEGGYVTEFILGTYRWFWAAWLRFYFTLFLGPYDAAWLECRKVKA